MIQFTEDNLLNFVPDENQNDNGMNLQEQKEQINLTGSGDVRKKTLSGEQLTNPSNKVNNLISQKNWMSDPDVRNKTLSQLLIPGSHGAATFQLNDERTNTSMILRIVANTGNAWICSQSISIYRQLQCGVRAFDLALSMSDVEDGIPIVSVGGVCCCLLAEAFEQIVTFLSESTTEVVMLFLHDDTSSLSSITPVPLREVDLWLSLYMGRFLGPKISPETRLKELVSRGQNVIYFWNGLERCLTEDLAIKDVNENIKHADSTKSMEQTMAHHDQSERLSNVRSSHRTAQSMDHLTDDHNLHASNTHDLEHKPDIPHGAFRPKNYPAIKSHVFINWITYNIMRLCPKQQVSLEKQQEETYAEYTLKLFKSAYNKQRTTLDDSIFKRDIPADVDILTDSQSSMRQTCQPAPAKGFKDFSGYDRDSMEALSPFIHPDDKCLYEDKKKYITIPLPRLSIPRLYRVPIKKGQTDEKKVHMSLENYNSRTTSIINLGERLKIENTSPNNKFSRSALIDHFIYVFIDTDESPLIESPFIDGTIRLISSLAETQTQDVEELLKRCITWCNLASRHENYLRVLNAYATFSSETDASFWADEIVGFVTSDPVGLAPLAQKVNPAVSKYVLIPEICGRVNVIMYDFVPDRLINPIIAFNKDIDDFDSDGNAT